MRVCFNYGCVAQVEAHFDQRQMNEVQGLLAAASNAADERQRLSLVVGRLLGWAGERTPIHADRGGNYADEGAFGRMDCIDHATTTTRLLHLLDGHGWLRFHRIVEAALRFRFLVFEHHAAQIEEVDTAASDEPGARYVVDSWFRDNGQPAVVLPLESWLDGAGEEEAVAAANGSLAGGAPYVPRWPGSWPW